MEEYDGWYIADEDKVCDTWYIADEEPELSWDIQYWKLAQDIEKAIDTIRNKEVGVKIKEDAAYNLRNLLQECLKYEELNHLTAIYRNKRADNILGYDTIAISSFIELFLIEYPKP